MAKGPLFLREFGFCTKTKGVVLLRGGEGAFWFAGRRKDRGCCAKAKWLLPLREGERDFAFVGRRKDRGFCKKAEGEFTLREGERIFLILCGGERTMGFGRGRKGFWLWVKTKGLLFCVEAKGSLVLREFCVCVVHGRVARDSRVASFHGRS